ncbi:MAG TPA: hypothetical protein VGU66_09240 [Candidatus Elarobacter sp.]|nr:hypothetical protein [Candidatus Elarobacter sp.]
MSLSASALAGWIGAGALVLAAVLGWVLRRMRGGPIAARMRPHLVLGYTTLAAASIHAATSGPSMSVATTTGIYAASVALAALAVQAFVGASLQAPGSYRRPLLAWHRTLLWLIVVLVGVHLVFNAPLF